MQRPRVGIFGAYLQDDFRLHRNLTVNLGLRYEFETPMRDPQDRLSRFLDLSSPIPEFQSSPPRLPAEAAALRKSAPIYSGAWVFTDPRHRGSWNPQKTVFLPRLGLAWRVNDRTSLRVGYARYVVPPIMTDGFGILGSTPYPGFDAMTKVLPALEGVPQSVLSDPYPARANPLIPPVGKSLGRYTNLGGEATWFHQDMRSGANERVNLSAQRQLPGRLVLDLTYFVNLGRDHSYESVGSPKDRNQLEPDYVYTYKSQIDRKVANPFFNLLTPDKFPGQLRNQQTVAIRELLKPYPQYGRLVEMLMPGISYRYQALQVKAQRPFANGFNFLLGYNYSRERRQEFFSDDDMFTDRLTWQDSPNPRHRLTLAGIWELPVGRNRAMLPHAPGLVDALLGGWSLSGIYTYNSGPFLRFGPAQVSGNPSIEAPTRDRMFDTSKFTRQPAYTPRTNPLQYPGVTGSRYANLDLTLAKIHPIAEGLKLEIRMEAYNASNSFMGANPVLNVDSSLFGRVVAQRGGFFGRQFQYSGRFIW
jgi:outer membrane receptor protein involved in Fe transport